MSRGAVLVKDHAPERTRLDLLHFVPFRLNRLAAEFSNALLADYGERFGLDIPEWRVLATLGPHEEPRSASYIVRCTRTHKSRISRAVAHLCSLGLVARIPVEGDRREVNLALTPQGRDLYEALVPRMLAREAELLSVLDERERSVLAGLLAKLERGIGIVTAADTDGCS